MGTVPFPRPWRNCQRTTSIVPALSIDEYRSLADMLKCNHEKAVFNIACVSDLRLQLAK